MKTLLTPIDFSSVTARVVDEAAELARALHARIVLLNVIEPTATIADFAVVTVSTAHVDDAAVKRAITRLDEWQNALNAKGISTEGVHVIGSPAQEIIEQAQGLPADYIVIGSHGHTALYDLLVGGTTKGVLKRAPCPVVIVPATGERKVKAAQSVHGEART